MTASILTEAPSVESLPTREHEVFVGVRSFADWQRCQHGKQIVTVKAHWSDDAPFTTTQGRQNSTQWFERTVHADGSESSGFEYGTITRCPKCKALGTLSTKQEAWGDRTTCSASGCGYEDYYSIGD